MTQKAPLHVIWWLVSRASGIVALVLISLSVLMGLAMAARAIRRPAIKRAVARLHEHVALVAILAIVIHGVALLGDHWLNPGWRGITVPFALSYRPAFTGLGIIAGYLTVLLGPSFYLRRRIGTKRWRTLHRGTIIIWVLAVVHTLGAGSDRSKLWMQWIVVAPIVPLVYLLLLRLTLSAQRPQRVENHAQVNHLLEQRAGHRRQRARRGEAHRDEGQPHPDQHALPRDRERATPGVERVRDPVDAIDGDDRVGGLRRHGGTGRAERDPDVRGSERGGIVDPVANHHDWPQRGIRADPGDDLEFVGG